MAKLKLYQYYDKPHELLKPNIEYKFGGTSLGVFNGKEIIISSKIYEKELKWDDAISYCKDLDIDGYKDWYLPDKDELNFMYENRDKLHKFDEFDISYHWSSTEGNGYTARHQNFINGSQYDSGKFNSDYVRAIRSQ